MAVMLLFIVCYYVNCLFTLIVIVSMATFQRSDQLSDWSSNSKKLSKFISYSSRPSPPSPSQPHTADTRESVAHFYTLSAASPPLSPLFSTFSLRSAPLLRSGRSYSNQNRPHLLYCRCDVSLRAQLLQSLHSTTKHTFISIKLTSGHI